MKRLVSILYLSCIFYSGCDENIIDPGEYGTGDEYEIYKLILTSPTHESDYLAVLNDSTVGERIDRLNPQQHIPELADETISDYINKNNENVKIKDIPGLSNYVFRSEYQDHAEKIVFVSISRVGFDKNKSQAVVTMGRLYAPLVGNGVLIFLKKFGSFWRIEKSIGTWIS